MKAAASLQCPKSKRSKSGESGWKDGSAWGGVARAAAASLKKSPENLGVLKRGGGVPA